MFRVLLFFQQQPVLQIDTSGSNANDYTRFHVDDEVNVTIKVHHDGANSGAEAKDYVLKASWNDSLAFKSFDGATGGNSGGKYESSPQDLAYTGVANGKDM